jgi:hypothetical protein
MLPPLSAERGGPGRPGWRGGRARHEDGVRQHGRAQLGGRAEEEDVARAGPRRLAVACRRGRTGPGSGDRVPGAGWSGGARALPERALQGVKIISSANKRECHSCPAERPDVELVRSLGWGRQRVGPRCWVAVGTACQQATCNARACPCAVLHSWPWRCQARRRAFNGLKRGARWSARGATPPAAPSATRRTCN